MRSRPETASGDIDRYGDRYYNWDVFKACHSITADNVVIGAFS